MIHQRIIANGNKEVMHKRGNIVAMAMLVVIIIIMRRSSELLRNDQSVSHWRWRRGGSTTQLKSIKSSLYFLSAQLKVIKYW